MDTFAVPVQPFLLFVVVLARIGGLLTFAPFFANRVTSPKIRISLALVIALALTPVLSTRVTVPDTGMGDLFVVILGELVIGLLFGLVGRIIFSGIEMAAFLVSSQMGFSLAGTIDPSTQAQTTAFGIIGQMLGLMVLLGADGHHWFLATAVKSFSTTPPGELFLSAAVPELLVRLSSSAILVGITLAAPAIIVLLAVEFALELFGRTAPQFQIFILGFPIKIAIGLITIGATLYLLPSSLREVVGGISDGLLKALGAI